MKPATFLCLLLFIRLKRAEHEKNTWYRLKVHCVPYLIPSVRGAMLLLFRLVLVAWPHVVRVNSLCSHDSCMLYDARIARLRQLVTLLVFKSELFFCSGGRRNKWY